MKKLILVLAALMCVNMAIAQRELGMVRATNCEAYYHTGIGATFSWTGGISSRYCNGYGTIQFYDEYGNNNGKYVGNVRNGKNEGYGIQYYSNGNVSYEGNWRNDERSGQGTKYNWDGSVAYSGNFENGDLEGIAPLNFFAEQAGQLIMQKIFDGGVDLSTRITRLTNNEIHARITFHGNFVWANVYDMTLVVRNYAPYVDIINANDNAVGYLTLKGVAMVADAIQQMYNSNSSNN